MKVRTWILPFCMLLLLGCGQDEGSQQTATSEPNRDAQPTRETAVVNTPSAGTEPNQDAQRPAREVAVSMPSKLGDQAWPLTGLTWIKGEPVSVAPGKVYVVEFWATWCPPCRVSIPHLTKIQQKYKDKGVIVVGISQENPAVVKPFVEQKGSEMEYAVAVDATGAVSKGYMDAFHRNGIPCAFVVDAQGKLVWVGHPMQPDMEAMIEKTLAAASDAQGG